VSTIVDVADPADPRLDDFRDLNSVTAGRICPVARVW
jgi:hypothetical protein